jgi:ferredoxin
MLRALQRVFHLFLFEELRTMANVTFTSPRMPRDVTVYAVAGHRGTLLGLAKDHKIPIPHDCQDGECASCVVEVRHVAPRVRSGLALTEKEKELLRQLGKITREEIMDAEVNDMPPRFRLACQCFVRNEDIIVAFEGDATVPAKGPALSIAAAIYKGGVAIRTLDEFLSYAVKVEEDAALHFEGLAEAMWPRCSASSAATRACTCRRPAPSARPTTPPSRCRPARPGRTTPRPRRPRCGPATPRSRAWAR